MSESKTQSSKTCSTGTIRNYVINCGYKTTSNVFFVMQNVYWEFLQTKQYTQEYPNKVIIHRQVQSSVYFYWSYRTGKRGYMTFDEFQTQLRLFKFLKSNHQDFMEKLLDSLVEHDLVGIALESEHLFSKS